MKYLYYCNSLYQVITALELHLQRKKYGFENINNYEADLIVLDAFSGANEIVNTIANRKQFNNIWLVDKKKIKNNINHFSTIHDLLFPKSFLNRIGLCNICYDYDYLTVSKYSKLLSAIWQINRNAKLQLFDEGLATYSLVVALESHSYIYKKFFKTFNYGRDFNDYEAIYVNSPELMIVDDCRVKRIPKNSQIVSSIKLMFDSHVITLDDEKKVYWFDQIFKSKELNEGSKRALEVLKHFKDDVLFLPHPRTPNISKGFKTIKYNTLWEINLLKLLNINNKCLITNSSTASLSPKLLFDMEPYIIMTFLLVEDEKSDHYQFMQKFISTYRDKNKIMLPKSIEELKDCLIKVTSEEL